MANLLGPAPGRMCGSRWMNDAESLLASRRTEWVIEWWISSFIILWLIEVSVLCDANFVVLVQANVSKLPARFLVILSTPI
jgi:hypothetical protein